MLVNPMSDKTVFPDVRRNLVPQTVSHQVPVVA